MSAARETSRPGPRLDRWQAGIVAGLGAGVGMGVVLSPTDFFAVVGSLVGWPTLVGGWLVHLAVSVGFALLFVEIVTRPLLSDYTSSRGEVVGLAVGVGALLGLVTGGLVLPAAVNLTGAGTLPVPLFVGPGGDLLFPVLLGVGHLVYGLVLGVLYARLAYPTTAGGPDTGGS